jgi:electron transfer flavoprotein alpha subunit
MSVLVYAESSDGKFKKVALEVTSYGKSLAEQLGTNLVVLTLNAVDPSELCAYGAEKVLAMKNDSIKSLNPKIIANIIQQATTKESASVVVIDSSADGLSIAPLVAVNLNAGYASNVVALPISSNPFVVKRNAFSNKGFNFTEINTEIKVVGLAKNSFGLKEAEVNGNVEEFTPSLIQSGVSSNSIDKTAGKVTIADADIVVSGGRGLKGPENWTMIEDLAEVLGAATACSKPVSDMEWRPHSEHVGQTGKPVSSNLYIAVGISGAIQHLAGVNASKVKVVINIDPEAPFFKAADYGIVGDAFEVVPALTEKLKEFKSNQ